MGSVWGWMKKIMQSSLSNSYICSSLRKNRRIFLLILNIKQDKRVPFTIPFGEAGPVVLYLKQKGE